MTAYIRDPFTGKTFTCAEWELEKERRKEQMAKEWRACLHRFDGLKAERIGGLS